MLGSIKRFIKSKLLHKKCYGIYFCVIKHTFLTFPRSSCPLLLMLLEFVRQSRGLTSRVAHGSDSLVTAIEFQFL